MSTPVTVRSIFVPSATILIDPWAENPLLDDARQVIPDTVALATQQNGDAPTLFESGPVPPFTASGVDPQVLMRLPWKFRHAAAMERNPAAVLTVVERHGYDGDGELPSPGLDDYVARFRSWLRGTWTNPSHAVSSPDTLTAAAADLYDSMFGEDEAALAQTRAAQVAADAAFRDMRNRTGQYADGFGRAAR